LSVSAGNQLVPEQSLEMN